MTKNRRGLKLRSHIRDLGVSKDGEVEVVGLVLILDREQFVF